MVKIDSGVMGQRLFTCGVATTELNEDQFLQIIPSSNPLQELEKHLKRLPEEILVKILMMLVENNFQVFYVNVFRMYPCFKKYRGTIERALKNEHLKQILLVIRGLKPRQCILLGEDGICGRESWEYTRFETDEYTLTLSSRTPFTPEATVKFIYCANGELLAETHLKSFEYYVKGTLERIKVPAKRKTYIITGIEMYGNAVRLKFIDFDSL